MAIVAPSVAAAVAATVLVAPSIAQAGTTGTGTTGTGTTPKPGSVGAPGLGDPLYPTLGNGGYTVDHYDLALEYGTAAPGVPLHGVVTLRARTTQELSRFDLDFSGKSLGSVNVNGAKAAFTRDGDELVVTPARPLHRGQPFTVTVTDFVAVPTVPDPNQFLSTVFIRTPDGTAWSGQPNGAHQIFPSNDHPSDKASFSFTVDAPASKTVVANGVLAGKKSAGGRTIWRYEQREPMATELAQVAVGDFTVINRGVRDGVGVRDVIPTKWAKDPKNPLSSQLAVVNPQLDWMRNKVGDYPFRTYGSLVIDATLGFALETQTLSLYDRPWFTDYPRGLWDPVMLHELSHQWFGDSVAPARWGDVWQNEGHATWYEWTYAAEKGFLADDAGIADFTALMKDRYAAGDSFRAKYGPVGTPKSGDVNDLFNPNVYDGGALVLYALQQKIGVKKFDQLERAWVTVNRGRSASTQDFIALASRISGQDLKPFLTAWLYGTKTPPMPGHLDWKVDPPSSSSSAAPQSRSGVASRRR
jgi:aminopeptidase N